ncbi:hypothetical protein [[Mycoplasma] imitans]|uniref:hypothetical protein n=1 Tax=[Mycoplasma] imitans TaxID=29560 RepID=UPI0012EB8769|nr:hypothetical protein [[Mycoplasma] imitans]
MKGTILALAIPSIFLSSCSALTLTRQSFADPNKDSNPNTTNPEGSNDSQNPSQRFTPDPTSPIQPFVENPKPAFLSVTIKPNEMQNTNLVGADRSNVVVDLSDNNITLNKPFQVKFTGLTTLKLLNTILKSPSLYSPNLIFTDRDGNWKRNGDENLIYISSGTQAGKAVTLLNFILNSSEYAKFNNLIRINNVKPNIITRIDPSNRNLPILASYDGSDFSTSNFVTNSYLQFNLLVQNSNNPFTINEETRTITFDNLTLEKRVYTRNNDSVTSVRNWILALGRFTIYNAF